jgi:cytochrome c peroxidase
MTILRITGLLAALALTACAYRYDTPKFGIAAAPTSFAVRPAVLEPVDNPSTPAKIELGGLLFADPGLSGDGKSSCASCHDPRRGFADGLAKSPGNGGRLLVRHTPTLLNVAYAPILFWDGRSPSLEDQALRPITNGGEMARHPAVLADAVEGNPRYQALFAAAFPGTGVSEANIARAIAAYERTLVSGTAPFDRFIAGTTTAISPAAARGFALFAGKANCAACHSGALLTDGKFHDVGLADDDLGRGGITNNSAFDHAFRTPALREIGRTAPYMHNGSLQNLAAVVDHYADTDKRRRGSLPPLALSAAERRDLVAFLQTLDSEDSAASEVTRKRAEAN